MLVPFVIDAESLAPDCDWSPTTTRACHGSLLELWAKAGILVHDGSEFEKSSLHRALQGDSIPVKVRSLWKDFLKRYTHAFTGCTNSWSGTVTPETLEKFDIEAAAALVDDTHATAVFDFSEDEDTRTVQLTRGATIDVCRIQAAAQASVFASARQLAGQHIQPKDTWQYIWDMRFAGLTAAKIKQVAIVDRYAMDQHVSCPQFHLSGLVRFLKLLAKDDQAKRYVTVFSAWTAQLREISLERLARDVGDSVRQFNLSAIRRLNLVMVPNDVFGLIAHDRFVRFESYVWEIGLGLEVFQGSCAGKVSSATFKAGSDTEGFEAIERNLRGAKGAREERAIG